MKLFKGIFLARGCLCVYLSVFGLVCVQVSVWVGEFSIYKWNLCYIFSWKFYVIGNINMLGLYENWKIFWDTEVCSCVCVCVCMPCNFLPKHFPNDKDEDVGYVLVVPKTHTNKQSYIYIFMYTYTYVCVRIYVCESVSCILTLPLGIWTRKLRKELSITTVTNIIVLHPSSFVLRL